MPIIKKPSEHFDAKIRTGAGGGSVTVSGIGFQPDLVWTKSRSAAYDHMLADSVRGTTKAVRSNLAAGELTADSWGYLSAFNSDGYTAVPGSANFNSYGASGVTYVDWMWKAGGTAVTNTSGTISSQVSVNTTAGFSIVKFSTGGAGNFTVGHGLGKTPAMITIKKTSASGYWDFWHKSFSNLAQDYMYLDLLNGVASDSRQWANAAPTDTLFSGESGYEFATNSNFIAYCWSEIDGYSKFSNYTGASSAARFVYTGFRPAFVLIKKTTEASTTYGWPIVDKSRPNGYNPTQELWADQAVNNTSVNYNIDLLSNGFCIREQNNTNVNESGKNYIYAAFAEAPFKYANAR